MAKVKIQGHASGTGILTVTAPNTSTDRTITLPDATGTLLNSDGDGSSLTGLSSFDPDAAVTINDSGADVDFRVESDTDANALFVQGSDGHVGIGVGAPQYKLQIVSTHASTPTMLSLRNNQTLAADVGARLRFQVGGDEYGDIIGAANSSSSGNGGYLAFNTRRNDNPGGVEALRITSDGRGLSQFTAKVWCNVNTSNSTISDSHNVSSITDNGTGDFTINFTNAHANANGVGFAHTHDSNHNSALATAHISANNFTGSCRVLVTDTGSNVALDGHHIHFLSFGD